MKIKGLGKVTIGLLFMSSSVFAATVDDLKLECGGEYKILNSQKYYVDNYGTRANSYFGNEEKIEVISVSGGDCDKLKSGYNVEVTVGEVITLGKPVFSRKLEWLGTDHDQVGKVVSFSAKQHHHYEMEDGMLPLFPLIHEEFVNILGKYGKADVAKLYGTPGLEEIRDSKKLEVVDGILQSLGWGKDLDDNYIRFYNEVRLGLALKLLPASEEAQKEYLNDMLLIFKNSTTFEASFVSNDHRIAIGHIANKLLNKFGETKHGASKLDVWKKNPIFFAQQLVFWIFDEVEKAPVLSKKEVEEYLLYALDMSKKLKEVQYLHEARVLLQQYKESAITIKKLSVTGGLSLVMYELSSEARSALNNLLEF